MSSWRASMRELRALLDEVAEIDWRHPAWWGSVAATAAFERLPARGGHDLDAGYLTSDGGPRSDTFMATPCAAADAAHAVAAGVVQARAAWDALATLDGTLPGQPLLCQLDHRGALARRRPLSQPRRAVFATPSGAYVATLGERATSDGELVRELARAHAGHPPARHRLTRVDPRSDALLDAAISVSLLLEEPATARHAHRRGWNTAGGPWLGVARAVDRAFVTTSHTVVDGYGHALIANAVLAAPVPDTLIAAARRVLDGAPLEPAPALAQALPLGIAVGELLAAPRFAELLYATGWALERIYRRDLSPAQRRRARFTPTLQIPIAPGAPDDPARLRRRVAPGLIALRMHRGELEDPTALRARLGALIAREAACAGALGRLREAALRVPLPASIKRRSLRAGAVPHPLAPPIEVLAGRGCLSSLGFPPGAAPPMSLQAASAPALDASVGDPRGGSVVTVVTGAETSTVTVSGTGLAGTEAGARAFLRAWEQGLERASALRSRAGALPEVG